MARGVWRLACTLIGVLVLLSLCQVKILTQYKPDLTEENRYMGRSLLQDNVENIRVSCAVYIYIYIYIYIAEKTLLFSYMVLFMLSNRKSKKLYLMPMVGDIELQWLLKPDIFQFLQALKFCMLCKYYA